MLNMVNIFSSSSNGDCKMGCKPFMVLSLMITMVTSSLPAAATSGNNFKIKAQEAVQYNDFDYRWIIEEFSAFDETTPARELIEFAARVKIAVERFMGKYFSVEELLDHCQQQFEAHGVSVDLEYFENLLQYVEEAQQYLLEEESGLIAKRKPHRQPDWFLDNTDDEEKLAGIGILCGGLMMAIPFPPIQWLGGFFVNYGLAVGVDRGYKWYRDNKKHHKHHKSSHHSK